MSNDDERGLLGLDESYTVVETRLDKKRLLVLGGLLLFGGGLRNGLETGFLLLSGLWAIPDVQIKKIRSIQPMCVTHLLRSLKSWVAVFLSKVCENWAIAGGTFRRCLRMTFWRWSRTYSGHFTKRVRSVLGRMSCPVETLRMCCIKHLVRTHRCQNYEAGPRTVGFWLIWNPPWNLGQGQAFCRNLAWIWEAKVIEEGRRSATVRSYDRLGPSQQPLVHPSTCRQLVRDKPPRTSAIAILNRLTMTYVAFVDVLRLRSAMRMDGARSTRRKISDPPESLHYISTHCIDDFDSSNWHSTTLVPTCMSNLVAVAVYCIAAQRFPRLLSALAGGVDNIAQLKSVEPARSTDRIRPHVVEPQPVTDLQRTRQLNRGAHAIYGVACRSPDAAR